MMNVDNWCQICLGGKFRSRCEGHLEELRARFTGNMLISSSRPAQMSIREIQVTGRLDKTCVLNPDGDLAAWHPLPLTIASLSLARCAIYCSGQA